MTIRRIEPGKRMSGAVVHGNTVYLAGQVGTAGDDVTAQTVTALAEVDKLLETYDFFAADNLPAGTYEGQDADVATISVGAQMVTSADQPEELIYGITKALYNENTQKLFAAGHAKGKQITLDNATTGAGIPFHPGAERFYKEVGKLQ